MIDDLSKLCDCRKPAPGMLLQAFRELTLILLLVQWCGIRLAILGPLKGLMYK